VTNGNSLFFYYVKKLNKTHPQQQNWCTKSTLTCSVYQPFVSAGDELKRAIVEAWQKVPQWFIDGSVGEWRRRQDCLGRQNGPAFWPTL